VWPDFLRGTLEDKYGLADDSLTVGVGLREGRPFLIVRQRQSGAKERPYAFTLLLDPGEKTWECYGWNGALLAWSLFHEDNEEGRRLLTEPEQFGLARLDELLANTGARMVSAIPDAEGFAALVAGSLALEEPRAVSAAALGWAGRRDLETLAREMKDLPKAWRCGAGWLNGGSIRHAATFGVRLVLDDWQEPNDEEIAASRKLLETGASWLADRRLAQQFKPNVLTHYEQTPAWQWTRPEHAVKRAELARLAEPLRAADGRQEIPDPELRAKIADLPPPQDLLARETWRAWLDYAAQSGAGALSPGRTEILFNAWQKRNLPFPKAAEGRLDLPVYLKLLVDTQTKPNEPTLPQKLSPADRAEVWRGLLETEEKITQIPVWLRDAALDAQSTSGETALAKLAETAVGRLAGESLRVWLPYRQEPALWPCLKNLLRGEARKRAQCRAPGWELDYLAFGADAGGAYLCNAVRLTEAEAGAVVAALRAEIDRAGSLRDEAQQWLIHLAETPLRQSLAIQDKVNLGDFSAVEVARRWAGPRDLWKLWQKETGPFGTYSEAEQGLLQVEAAKLAAHPPQEGFTPRTEDLARIIGPVPPDLADLLEDARRRQLAAARPGPEELLQKILSSEERLPFEAGLAGFTETELETFAAQVWWRFTQRPAEAERARLLEVCATLRRETRYHKAVAQGWEILKRKPDEMGALGLWLQSGLDEPPDDLIGCMTEKQQEELVAFLRRKQGHPVFATSMLELYRARRRDKHDSLFRLAAWRFLQSEEGKRVRMEINTKEHAAATGRVANHLKQWLEEAEPPVYEPGNPGSTKSTPASATFH
jgi:hypothetical protein